MPFGKIRIVAKDVRKLVLNENKAINRIGWCPTIFKSNVTDFCSPFK